MKFSPEIAQRIIVAIVSKLPDKRWPACSVCGQTQWELLDAFVPITITAEPQMVNLVLPAQILPCAVLICKICGNTVFLNLNRLGLGDLLKPEPEPSVPSPSASPSKGED